MFGCNRWRWTSATTNEKVSQMCENRNTEAKSEAGLALRELVVAAAAAAMLTEIAAIAVVAAAAAIVGAAAAGQEQ